MSGGSLTRIRNNQVYNSDINASAKLVAKSVTGGLLSDNFTYTGNMTIGNLTVNGNTTTLDTTNVVIADPLFSINRNQSGAPSYDLGMVMGRGNQTNVAFIWEEAAKQFQLQYTTESTSSTTFGTINNSGYANLQAYGIVLNNATIGTLTVTSALQAPNFTATGGGQFTGYFTGAIGANTANSGAFTTLSTTGNATIQGNILVTGNIIPSASNTYSLGSSTNRFANLWIKGTTIYLGAIAVSDGGGYLQVTDPNTNLQLGIQTASINNTVIGNTGPASGTFTAANVNGTLYAATVNAATIGNSGTAISGATSTMTGASQAASYTATGGGQVSGYLTGAIGANSANSGAFTTVTATSTITAQGTVSAPTVNAGTIGNSGAVFNGASINLTGNASINAISAYQVGNTSTILEGTIGSATPSQPNITSLGTLTSLNSTGNITAQTANVYGANFVANTASYSPIYYYSNGINILNAITASAYSNANAASYLPTYNGNIGNLATGNLIPLANTSYYLGNSTNYYANAYANNFNAITQLATPKIQFTVGGASILEDNSLDLAIVGPYQISIKPASYQYTFNNNGSLSGPGGTFVYANGAIYGNITATGAYWANGVSFASTITGTYSNSNVNSYLPTYTGTLSPSSLTTNSGGQITGYHTGAIGANTANSGAFTTVTATGALTAQGTITGGGQVVGYFNGAIGANTANSGVFTTASTSGNLTVGGNLNLTGNVVNITANVYSQGGIFYGAATTGFNALYAGQSSYTPLAQTLVQISGNYNGFVQVNEQNTNSGSSASTDFIATANNGSDNDTYIDLGINSSGYVNATYGLQAANDGYLYVAGNTTTGGGNLVISTTTANDIIYSLGGIGTANEFARMRANTNSFVISSTTSATSTTSGALQVRGGAGVSGNLYVGTASYSPIYYYANGVNILNAVINSAYSNTNAAAYLTTYTGNLLAGNITALNNITGYLNGTIGANAANSATFTTVSITNTANSYAAGQGALQISGGFYVAGDSYIAGNLIVGNLQAVQQSILTVQEPLLYLQSYGISNYNYDIGFYGHFIGGNNNNYQHTGLVRNYVDNEWYLFSNVGEPSGNVVSFNSNTVYDTLKLGALLVQNTTTSSSSTSGALQVAGGAGIAGALYAGSIQNTPIGSTTPSSGVFTGVTSTGQVTGYLTGAIGANTANSGAFTTLTTTGGAAFNSNATLTTDQATVTLFNLSSTTINLGGAATSVNIGASTGTTTVANSLKAASVTTSGGGQVVGYFNGAIGANTANSGVFTTVTASGNITAQTANVYAANVIGNTALYGGQFYWSNGASLTSTITGLYSNSNVATYLPTYTGTLSPSSLTTNSGGQVTAYLTGAIGANVANSGVFTTANVNGTLYAATLNAATIGNSGATFNGTSINLTGNASVNAISAYQVGNTSTILEGTIGSATPSQPNITSLGTLTSLTVSGTAAASSINAGTIGNSGAAFNGASINLTGNASVNAISAFQIGNTSTILEGTIGSATPSQPNITSLGTLTSLTVSGTVAAPTINAGTIGNAGAVFNGASINLTGNASVNAISAFQVGNTSTILEGTIGSATPSQPNITSVGTLTSLTTSGNITAQTANVYAAYVVANTVAVATNFFYPNGVSIAATIAAATYSNTNAGAYLTVYNGNIAANYITAVQVGNTNTLHTGYLTTGYQPNIVAVGTLANLSVTATITGSVSGNAGTATALQTSRNINGTPFNGTSDITVTVDANNLTGTTLASGVTASSLQSVGFLNNLSVNGNINTCNSVITNSVTAGVYTQNISTYDGVGNLNVYVPRNANLTVNAAQVAANLVVHGNSAAGYQNLLVTSGATGQVGIKVAPNAITAGASLEINSTDSIQIPVGTTSQRPATGAAGMIRYNTTSSQFEYYNASTSAWVGAQGAYTTITESSFTGDGSTTTFTLAQNSTTNGTFVSVNGVLQIPTTAYSVSGNVLTFTEAPISTDIIDARVVAATTTVTGISGSTGGSAAVQANSSVYITGGLAPAVNPTTLTQNTPTTIDTFPTSTYRVAKYVIKVSDSTNGVYCGAELIVAHNGTTATSQVYGVVNTGANALATFSSSISGGNVNVTANTWSSTATATVFQTYMPV